MQFAVVFAFLMPTAGLIGCAKRTDISRFDEVYAEVMKDSQHCYERSHIILELDSWAGHCLDM